MTHFGGFEHRSSPAVVSRGDQNGRAARIRSRRRPARAALGAARGGPARGRRSGRRLRPGQLGGEARGHRRSLVAPSTSCRAASPRVAARRRRRIHRSEELGGVAQLLRRDAHRVPFRGGASASRSRRDQVAVAPPQQRACEFACRSRGMRRMAESPAALAPEASRVPPRTARTGRSGSTRRPRARARAPPAAAAARAASRGATASGAAASPSRSAAASGGRVSSRKTSRSRAGPRACRPAPSLRRPGHRSGGRSPRAASARHARSRRAPTRSWCTHSGSVAATRPAALPAICSTQFARTRARAVAASSRAGNGRGQRRTRAWGRPAPAGAVPAHRRVRPCWRVRRPARSAARARANPISAAASPASSSSSISAIGTRTTAGAAVRWPWSMHSSAKEPSVSSSGSVRRTNSVVNLAARPLRRASSAFRHGVSANRVGRACGPTSGHSSSRRTCNAAGPSSAGPLTVCNQRRPSRRTRSAMPAAASARSACRSRSRRPAPGAAAARGNDHGVPQQHLIAAGASPSLSSISALPESVMRARSARRCQRRSGGVGQLEAARPHRFGEMREPRSRPSRCSRR